MGQGIEHEKIFTSLCVREKSFHVRFFMPLTRGTKEKVTRVDRFLFIWRGFCVHT